MKKVFAEIVSWKDKAKAPLGKVIKVFGQPGENDAEMHAIAMEKGFDEELPEKVYREAREIKTRGIEVRDYVGRRDMRKILIFTIDPEDAKDFYQYFKEITRSIAAAIYDELKAEPGKEYSIDFGHGLYGPLTYFEHQLIWQFELRTVHKGGITAMDKTLMVVDDTEPEVWYSLLRKAGFQERDGQQ